MLTRAFRLFLVASVSFGCRAKLGECDQAALEASFVETPSGTVMFAGQALMNQFCATRCHGSALTGADRFGAPFGFDLDVVHLDPTLCSAGNFGSEACIEEQRRLTTATQIAFDFRDLSWNEIAQDRMPPDGRASITADATVFRFLSGVNAGQFVPTIRDESARQMIRNWLACGLPVVGPIQTSRSASDLGMECEEPESVIGICRVGNEPVTVIDDSFEAIFEYFEQNQQCNQSGCHGGATPIFPEMSTRDLAHTNLTTMRGNQQNGCDQDGLPLIDTADPDSSVLLLKLLEPEDDDSVADVPDPRICGELMPAARTVEFPVGITDAVRGWIAGGAPNDDAPADGM